MSIVSTDEIIEKSNIADRLKLSSSAPLSYMREPIEDSSKNYYTLEQNSENIFSNTFNQFAFGIRNEIFKNLAAESIEYQYVDMVKDASSLSVSFDGLSSIVANAFVPLTNIRKSTFNILKSVDGQAVLSSYSNIYAFLTDSAILSSNSSLGTIANNSNQSSMFVIKTKEQLLSSFPANVKTAIRNLRPTSDEVISAYKANDLVDYMLSGTKYISDTYSCIFSDSSAPMPSAAVYLIYHSVDESLPVSAELSVYSSVKVSSYQEVFPGQTVDVVGWIDGSGNAYKSGDTIDLADENVDLYPVAAVNVSYLSTNNVSIKSSIDASGRPPYVLTASKTQNSVVEKVLSGSTDFWLPPCQQYFDAAPHATFVGWKNPGSSNLYDYANSTQYVPTGLKIDEDTSFVPVAVIPSDDPTPVVISNSVDIRITNKKIKIADNKNGIACDISSAFGFDVLFDGSIIKAVDSRYVLSASANGNFKFKPENISLLKSITVSLSAVGNTKHVGKYLFKTFINSQLKQQTNYYNFVAAESFENRDNFGDPAHIWNFVETYYDKDGKPRGGYSKYVITFNFQNLNAQQQAVDLSRTFLRINGYTGTSTSNLQYPYRCRLYMKITDVQYYK